jgi:hypothetical protein
MPAVERQEHTLGLMLARKSGARRLLGHTGRTIRMSEPAKVFEDREVADQWRVEWVGDDGRGELQIFTGPDARRQALLNAMQNYTHFKEVQLEPFFLASRALEPLLTLGKRSGPRCN